GVPRPLPPGRRPAGAAALPARPPPPANGSVEEPCAAVRGRFGRETSRETRPRDELLLPKGSPGRALRQLVSPPLTHPPPPETHRRPPARPRKPTAPGNGLQPADPT